MAIEAAILTVSDSCAQGDAEDLSGAALAELVQARGWRVAARACVADEASQIEPIVRQWCDLKKIPIIVVTGGTGVGPRDVTPEAVCPLLEKELPGFGEIMRGEGRKSTPLAALSRSLAGTRKASLILAVPGSPKGARESFEAVAHLVEHVLEILSGAGHGRRARPRRAA